MKVIYKYTINLALVLVMLPVATAHGQEMYDSITPMYNISFTRMDVNYYAEQSFDIGGTYRKYYCQHPTVKTFVNNDGTVTVCSWDDEKKRIYIYEYSMHLNEIKTLNFDYKSGILGAFTKDDDGNYYFFYAAKTNRGRDKNMTVIKYNKNGQKMKQYNLKALAPNSFNGVKIPFDAGTCRLEISGSMLAVYFAREMFNGHQASYGFILDRDNFKRIDNGQVKNNKLRIEDINVMPYVSHSFNQFILPIKDGFLFADHGDAYPRSFCFNVFINGSRTKRLRAFTFPGWRGENETTAQMGGVAKTSTGYIFAGTYGQMIDNHPRNLFILTFDDNLSACSDPVYLTRYTADDENAGSPKIVALDANRYLLLWEKFNNRKYDSTRMLVINEKGEALSDEVELKNVRLNMNDVLRYNPHNGKVYWAINESRKSLNSRVKDTNAITVYALSIKN